MAVVVDEYGAEDVGSKKSSARFRRARSAASGHPPAPDGDLSVPGTLRPDIPYVAQTQPFPRGRPYDTIKRRPSS